MTRIYIKIFNGLHEMQNGMSRTKDMKPDV